MYKDVSTCKECAAVDPEHDGKASIDIQSWSEDIQVETIF